MKAVRGSVLLLSFLLISCGVESRILEENENIDQSVNREDSNAIAEKEYESKENASAKAQLEFTVLGKETLYIDYDRIESSFLDSRWTLEETDKILNAIKGYWAADEYVGFVSARTYYPELRLSYDIEDTLIEELEEEYERKVEEAKAALPELTFSVKEDFFNSDVDENCICIDGYSVYSSPIRILLSMENEEPGMLASATATAASPDFVAEYPVLYLKFFYQNKETSEHDYLPATLVITSDDRFYLLINGAFYSLKQIEYPTMEEINAGIKNK